MKNIKFKRNFVFPVILLRDLQQLSLLFVLSFIQSLKKQNKTMLQLLVWLPRGRSRQILSPTKQSVYHGNCQLFSNLPSYVQSIPCFSMCMHYAMGIIHGLFFHSSFQLVPSTYQFLIFNKDNFMHFHFQITVLVISG